MGYIINITKKNKITEILTSERNYLSIPAGNYCIGLSITPTIDEELDVSDVISGGVDLEEKFPVLAGVASTILINKKYEVETKIYIDNYADNLTVTAYFL